MAIETEGKYPQDSYATVVCVIQLEWIFLQRVMKDTVHPAGEEKLLWETFLPCFFFRKYKSPPLIIGTLSTTTVNKSGPYLQYPVTSENEWYLSLIRLSSELIGSVTEASVFSTANHLLTFREERCDGQKIRDDTNNATLKGLVNGI